MAAIDRFESFMRQAWKAHFAGDADTGIMDAARAGFIQSLPVLPESMKHDLFNFMEEANRPVNEDREGMAPLTEALGRILQLFDGDLMEDDTQLTDEELGFVKDIVADFALEIDQDLVLDIMKIAVSRGLFDS